MANPQRKSVPRRRDQVSLISEILPDGRYGIVMSRGETVRLMDRDDVFRHCQAVVEAAVRAQHDAAVFNQMHAVLGLPVDVADQVVTDLRDKRLPLDAQALQPLGLTPGVTVQGKPFLVLSVNGHRVGQWTPGDARNHALACMELAAAVDLDNAYRDILVDDLEQGDRAHAVVGGLAELVQLYKVVEA